MNVEGLVSNAPTRVGKSHTGVTHLLTEHGDVPTLFASRSINETSNMVRIAGKVVDGTPVMEVVGREHFCVNPELKRMYRDIRAVNDVFPFHFMCQMCPLSKGRIPSVDIFAEKHVLSYRDIVEAAMALDVCPARLAYKYARSGVHIITNYSFLVDPAVREASFLGQDGFSPVNLFMDEADVLVTSLVRSNAVSFLNTGLRQIVDREIHSLLRSFDNWHDTGVFDVAESFVEVISHIKPSVAGVTEFVKKVDVGYDPHDLDVLNADLRDILTSLKRSYDIGAKIEKFNRLQVSATKGFFIQKLLMGIDYLSTDLDGYTRLPEVVEVVDSSGRPTGVGVVECPRYVFYDDGYYMNFRNNVSFLEDPGRWKCFTSATIDPVNYLHWIQVRGDYVLREFPHVIDLKGLPFYSFRRGRMNTSIRGMVSDPGTVYSALNRVLKAFIDKELSCYVGFPSSSILRQYREIGSKHLPYASLLFADGDSDIRSIQYAPINSRPCAIYFDYARSRTVRGLDFYNYDVAILVSLPTQNLAEWEWEAQQLTRIAGRFRDRGMSISGQLEVRRRAINEAAQFFSRIYTPENYREKRFVSLDWRVVEYANLAPMWVRDLLSNVTVFDLSDLNGVFGAGLEHGGFDIVEYLKPLSPRSVSQLADALGRSSDEIRNALDRAVSEGKAVCEGDVYYRAPQN